MSKDLSIKVRAKLYGNDMTMLELAKQMNLSLPYVSDIIRGKKNGPKAQEHIKKIKYILEIKD